MNLLRRYTTALELTHRMLDDAINQEWDSLVRTEEMRSRIVKELAKEVPRPQVPDGYKIAEVIAQIERDDAEIVERIQRWQKDVKILLRMKEPTR